MANISASTEEKIFRIKAWKGLNENPDGDTKLKLGEAAVMRNFKITRDGNLQRRPGTDMVKGLMQNYTLEVEDVAKAVRVDDGIPGQLVMQSMATASDDGLIILGGDEAIVTAGNAETYQGYYWKYGGFTYQFVNISQDGETYTWNMKQVKAVSSSADKAVAGLWAGNVKGTEYLVGACDGKLWELHNGADWCKTEIGSITTTAPVHMFGYSEKLYIINGTEYKEWDGTTLKDVEGYRPLVTIGVSPAGGGAALEQVNKLTGKRKCWFSPDGEANEFALPEKDLKSIDYVMDTATKENMSSTEYSVDLAAGKVTFTTAPSKGINSIEIGWENKNSDRENLVKMRYSETFNGANDNRVFLYGDGTNQAFYSGLDRDGNSRADYFPDMNVLKVGEANTKITALIRHYSRLLAFKENSVYSVQYGITTLTDDNTMATFYTTPINRAIGNAALGQVRLVLNSPRSVFGNDLYEWKNNSSYSSNLSVDERQAHRISDRIYSTLDGFDLSKVYCFDDNDNQEYYICFNGKALVHNYAADAWYYYTDFPVACMVNFRGDLYLGDMDGRLNSVSYSHRTDNGKAIKSYWESGSESFDREYMRKYSAMLWVGVKPESHGEVTVTVQTDRKSTYSKKIVASSLASFADTNFKKWSFSTNRKPKMNRSKIKAKKFVFYKLVFQTESINTTVTILAADIRVRFTGYAR